MSFDFLQAGFLAVLQGVTEFLPISSSGHLILPAALLGWQDQGLVFDVAVHVGSLVAVITYFRSRIIELVTAWARSLVQGETTGDSKTAWLLLIATVPAGLAGLLLGGFVDQYARSTLLIATTSIVFALLLYAADRRAVIHTELDGLQVRTALLIGFAQVLALIPGTSRSGITMTAGRFVGLSRHAASQFSFLLAIPIIAASGLLKTVELLLQDTSSGQWVLLAYSLLVSALVSYLCIHYFLRFIDRVGFLPFVIYRVLLGVVLFAIYGFL